MLLLSQHSRVAVASSRAHYDRIVASVSDRLECQLRRLVSESMFGVNDYCGLATGPCDLKVWGGKNKTYTCWTKATSSAMEPQRVEMVSSYKADNAVRQEVGRGGRVKR